MNSEHERETVLFTVSREVAEAAAALIGACENCDDEASLPFDVVLDQVMAFSGVHTDYFMPESPACPRCKSNLTEKTLIEWAGGIELESTIPQPTNLS
jgi:hypothetical protein